MVERWKPLVWRVGLEETGRRLWSQKIQALPDSNKSIPAETIHYKSEGQVLHLGVYRTGPFTIYRRTLKSFRQLCSL